MKNVLKQTWWDDNLNSKMETFLNWVGNSDAESKIFFRNFLRTSDVKFKNCLDVGCGPATEFFGFKKDGIDIKYTGVDSSTVLNKINTEKGVSMIQAEGHSIPVDDSSYELVFSRHVLEHQLSFEPILEEMIRVSSNLATHIFFIKPSNLPQEFIWTKSQQENLYHNRYNVTDIENFLKLNKKVDRFEWKEINELENVLLIWIKHNG
jgi:ubiquinone/menaquinone biosynthesis C-methylase UbiE